MKNIENLVLKEIDEVNSLFKKNANYLNQKINNISAVLYEAIKNDKTIFICGNGGSASQSQHFAGELIGRFINNRPGFKAISLASDTAVISCISNDYGYEKIFSHQLNALANENDILICLSTSGQSKNIIEAFKEASALNLIRIGFFGKRVKNVENLTDHNLIVDSFSTARVQEVHLLSIHAIHSVN